MPIDTLWLVAIPAVAGIALVAAVALRVGRPRYRARPLMTDNEREFHVRLARALPAQAALYPQVPILALLEPAARPRSAAFRNAFRAISNRRVDWVVEHGSRITVIELDDRTHDPRADARRDALLTKCGYRVLRYQSRSKPGIDEIRRDLAPG